MGDRHSMEDCPLREIIESNSDRSKENKHSIEKIVSGDWYSNKQLFGMIQQLKNEMAEFNQNVAKYNGLIEERKKDRKLLENIDKRVDAIEQEKNVKKKTTESWKDWISWIISIILLFLYLIELGVI